MSEADNRERDSNIQLGASQPELAIADVPQSERHLKRLRKPRNLPRTEAPLFANRPYEMMATGAPVISATIAFLKTPDWNKYESSRLYFQKPFGKGRYIEFYILNNQEHQPEFIASKAEQEILDRYGVMAARLHAVFATYAAAQAEPWKESFILRGSELIKTLQVYRTKKLTKSQKLKAIADLAWVVGTLGAVIHWYEGELNLCVRERSLLWIVSVQEYTQPNLLGEADELCEVIIRVQPGLWTYNFFNFERERQRKALYQYGLIPKQLFNIDPYRQKLAASLGLYLIQNSRARKSGIYTIESLLSNVLPKADIEQALTDRRYGWKLKESVDNALLVLRDTLGLEIEFDDKTYPQWLRPVWSLPNNLAELPTKERNQHLMGSKRLPDRYILNHWFPALVTFKLPSQIQESLNKLAAHGARAAKKTTTRRSRKSYKFTEASKSEDNQQLRLVQASQPMALTGTMVQQARKSLQMSQTELAQAMGKSQSWVRDIEHKLKDQPLKPEYAQRLRAILQIS
jgi:DNA-binding transcriptional regulator YiaG